jgi:ubiquitin C-terminal hydrolase
MEIDSVSKEDEQRRRFEKDVESVLSDKVLDIKKTFVKKKWETVKKKQSNSPPPTLNRRDIETQPCGLYNSGNFCYVNSFLQVGY